MIRKCLLVLLVFGVVILIRQCFFNQGPPYITQIDGHPVTYERSKGDDFVTEVFRYAETGLIALKRGAERGGEFRETRWRFDGTVEQQHHWSLGTTF